MNRHSWKIFLRVLASLFGELLLAIVLIAVFGGFGGIILCLVIAVQSWVLVLFFHYRHLRQIELVQLLATAAAAQQPLAPALWAYLIDRPRSPLREVSIALALSMAYWGWVRRDGFDHKVRRLATLLESGTPLYHALRAVPGVASRDTILAAAVGQATGQLADCLNNVSRWRMLAAWIDLVPRFLYPLVVLFVISALVSFQMIFIIPKFEKIFADFKLNLPVTTEILIQLSRFAIRYQLILLALFVSIVTAVLYYFSATMRWYFPVLGRFYRMQAQSRLLKMLGLLLGTGHTVPEALGILIDADYFSGPPRQRLSRVLIKVSEGGSLAEELHREALLPTNMMPLVQAAAKANNLPWAFVELGDHQARRTMDLTHRFVMAVFPLTILAMGLVVGFVALSLFLPLLNLINSLEIDVMAGNARKAFTLIEITAALAILTVIGSLVAQLAFWSLRERLHTQARHLALELADNALEAARATPWEGLTGEWAAQQGIPSDVAAILRDGKLQVKVQAEQTGTRRVTATVSWQVGEFAEKVELTTLLAPRARSKGDQP